MKWFTNLKLTSKLMLLSSFIAIVAALCGVVIVSTFASFKTDTNAAQIQTATLVTIITISTGVLVLVIMNRYISQITAKPLNKSTQAIDLIAIGDISAESIFSDGDKQLLTRHDEIGSLVRSIMNLVNSTKEKIEATQRITRGDLTAKISVNSDADSLSASLSALTENLNYLITGIASSAGQVASGANLVSSTSTALSQGALTQASTIQQLTASLEEISVQTAKNAENALKAKSLSENAKKLAASGNIQMDQVLRAMDHISDASAKINHVIKALDDIAFQTNILALNASVEASRAGAHGKGFAVVADEVRSLSGKSSRAVEESSTLIDNSLRSISSGIADVKNAAGTFKGILYEIETIAELVQAIAAASAEQACRVAQINKDIGQVSQVVQENAASSEESAVASVQLSGQADNLIELVSVFKVTGHERSQTKQLSKARL